MITKDLMKCPRGKRHGRWVEVRGCRGGGADSRKLTQFSPRSLFASLLGSGLFLREIFQNYHQNLPLS